MDDAQKIVIPGGSGFLGRTLQRHLSEGVSELVVLSRHPGPGSDRVREVAWDGRSAGDWAGELDGAQAIINLAGASINCRFTLENRARILTSRIDSVHAIAQAIGACAEPPPVWIQAAAVGIYGDAGDCICDEETTAGGGFVADVCRDWEAGVATEQLEKTRKVILRIGPVLGRGGGALEKMAGLARKGLGGTAGHGKQWISWIHAEDLCRMIVWALNEPTAAGVYNATSRQPLPNREFMAELRRVLGVRFGPPAPALAVKLGSRFLGVDSTLALTGQRCRPGRALAAGFDFEFPELSGALADLLTG